MKKNSGGGVAVVAAGCGHVGNLEGSSGPWKVVQALREQSGMSTPDSRGAVDNSGSANHLLSEQIDQQQGCIAVRAVTAQADGASEQMAVRTATLADEAFTAAAAFVDGPRHDRAAALEVLAKACRSGAAGSGDGGGTRVAGGHASNSVPETKSRAAAARPGNRPTITRTVTHGRCRWSASWLVVQDDGVWARAWRGNWGPR